MDPWESALIAAAVSVCLSKQRAPAARFGLARAVPEIHR